MRASIRPIRGSDVRAVAELSQHHFPLARIDDGEVRRRISSGIAYIVAEYDGKVVGFVDLKLRERNAHISGIAVHPEYEGRGIGTMLINSAVDFARKNGKAALMLTVKESNAKAVRFYSRLGFSLKGAKSGRSGGVLILWRGLEN